MSKITLRGYAAPYGQLGISPSGYEKFAVGAFSKMLSRWRNIDLRFRNHSHGAPRLASTGSETLKLFTDDFGIAFSASLDLNYRPNFSFLQQITRRSDPMAYCSIGGLEILAHGWGSYGSANLRVVGEAKFNHIAIVDGGSAAYKNTAVWVAGDLDKAPPRIRELDVLWVYGNARWDEARAAERREPQPAAFAARCSGRPDDRRAIGRTVTGDFVMMSTTTGRLSLLRAAPRTGMKK